MSWADEANDRANVQWYNPDHGEGDCQKCRTNIQVREGFELGAKWQRGQLKSDEAVEQVGQAIAQAHGQTPVLWTQYEGAARAAITALLGDE